MNSTLTLNLNTTGKNTADKNTAKTITAAQLARTLACKWDLLAVVGLMTSCTAYGLLVLGGVA